MRLIIFTSLVLFSVCVSAQNYPVRLQNNQELHGSFVQMRYLFGFDKPIPSRGIFRFDHNRGLIWMTQEPFETRLAINENGLTQQIDGQEIMKLSTEKFPELQTLYDVLALSMQGQWQALEERFDTKLTESNAGWQFVVASVQDGPFDRLQLEGDTFLSKLIIVKYKGDRDEIFFQSQEIKKMR